MTLDSQPAPTRVSYFDLGGEYAGLLPHSKQMCRGIGQIAVRFLTGLHFLFSFHNLQSFGDAFFDHTQAWMTLRNFKKTLNDMLNTTNRGTTPPSRNATWGPC